jgi:hypothetical protein
MLYETMILREKVRFKKAPILDLGRGFQIIIDFKSWNLEYETQKLPAKSLALLNQRFKDY